MEKNESLILELDRVRQLCHTILDRIRDLERLGDSLRVRMEDIDKIPGMQKDIDSLEVKVRKLEGK